MGGIASSWASLLSMLQKIEPTHRKQQTFREQTDLQRNNWIGVKAHAGPVSQISSSCFQLKQPELQTSCLPGHNYCTCRNCLLNLFKGLSSSLHLIKSTNFPEAMHLVVTFNGGQLTSHGENTNPLLFPISFQGQLVDSSFKKLFSLVKQTRIQQPQMQLENRSRIEVSMKHKEISESRSIHL